MIGRKQSYYHYYDEGDCNSKKSIKRKEERQWLQDYKEELLEEPDVLWENPQNADTINVIKNNN